MRARHARLLPVLAAVLLLVGPAVAPAATPSAAAPPPALVPTACPVRTGAGIVCAVLPVPLDHSGVVPGALGLRVEIQDATTEAQRHDLLIVLAGGPGQSGADYAPRAIRQVGRQDGYRVVTLDQRGTGPDGALVCPALSRVSEQALLNGACAGQLGDRRRFFTTGDSVADLELLRRALGADRAALVGTSYGTFVAQQYARIHPATTGALILDSPVPAAGADAFGLAGYAAIRRVLGAQCADGRCRGVTDDPVGDLGRTVRRLTDGTLRATTFDRAGRRLHARLRGDDGLLALLADSDLNVYARASLPAALRAAADGDGDLLLRLLEADGATPPDPPSSLSRGLNAATLCLDSPLPYALTDAPAVREQRTAAALDAVPPALYAPFTRPDVVDGSLADFCAGWPTDRVAAPSAAPLPPVPTLILSGGDDLRTPRADAEALRATTPTAALYRFPGVGHSVLDSDRSWCAIAAVRRLLRGRALHDRSCGGNANRTAVRPRPASRLAAVATIPGTAADPGRVARALLQTMDDAAFQDAVRRGGDAGARGGGLRGGCYRSSSRSVTLDRYALVPGVRVSGRYAARPRGYVGRMRIDGPGRLDGTLRVTPDAVVGRIGGTPVRLRLR